VQIDTRETQASWDDLLSTRAARFAPKPRASPKTQAVKERAGATNAITTDVAPVRPPERVSIALAGIAVSSLDVVLRLAFGRGRCNGSGLIWAWLSCSRIGRRAGRRGLSGPS
jgi:hypothetical protein